MSEESYKFDSASGTHRLEVTEVVPNWWLRKDWLLKLAVAPLLFVAVIALVLGFVQTVILILAGLGWLVWRYGGFFNKFPCTVAVNQNTGRICIESAYRERHVRKSQPHRFFAHEVGSVERATYATENPGAMVAMKDEKQHARDLSEAHNFEVVKVVLRDGQAIDLAWQYGSNDAARLHKALIELFAKAREGATVQRKMEERLRSLKPGDAPL